jgi:hypothetical protein
MKLIAGPELDAWIAGHVLKYAVMGGRIYDSTGGWVGIPAYSTDIAAAFRLIRGRLFELSFLGDSFGWRARFLAEQPGEEDVEWRATTAPLAICAAVCGIPVNP